MVYKILVFIVLFVFFLSCSRKNAKHNENSLKSDRVLNVEKKRSITNNDDSNTKFQNFLHLINNKENEFLPIRGISELFYCKDVDLSYLENIIRKQYDNLDKSDLILEGSFILDSVIKMFPVNGFKNLKIDSLVFNKRFTISDNINAVIFKKSLFDGSEAYLKVLLTYNSKTNKYIDSKYISISGAGPSNWTYLSGFFINKKNYVFSVSHIIEEDLYQIIERKLKILDNGKIDIVKIEDYEIDIEKKFHDYKNDYKEFTIPQISTEEKKALFTKYIAKIPSVSLPYNSGAFYKHMEIASPEEGKPSQTVLHHNQLKFYDEVKYFFSNNSNDIAFKKEGNDYKEGYYFYPIGKFDIAEEKVGVLYLYQSFCNYHPTIYVQLNTYDSQGNIITTKILDRRFYSGAYRFLSSIDIQENFKIDIKSFIQDYEDYGYEGTYEQKQPEIKETFLQINNDGSITK